MVTYTCICNRWLHMPVTDGYVRIKKPAIYFKIQHNSEGLQPGNQPTNHTITPTKILRHLRLMYHL